MQPQDPYQPQPMQPQNQQPITPPQQSFAQPQAPAVNSDAAPVFAAQQPPLSQPQQYEQPPVAPTAPVGQPVYAQQSAGVNQPQFMQPPQQPMQPGQPIAPQMPQQSMGGYVPPMNPQQQYNTTPPMSSGAAGGNRRRKISIVGTGIAVVVALVVAGSSLLMGQGTPTYKDSDLTSYTTDTYTASYPKQWEDLSNNKEVIDQIGLTGVDLADARTYAYGYDEKTNKIASGVVTATEEFPVDDETIKAALEFPELRQNLETSLKETFDDLKSEKCESATGDPELKLDGDTYTIEATAVIECTLSEEDAKTVGADKSYLLLKMGIADKKLFYTVVVTVSDWSKNKDFYQNSLLTSMQPK